MKPSEIAAVIEKLGRKGFPTRTGEVIYTDALPPPTNEEWEAAVLAIRTRRTISAADFSNLFTTEEKHAIARRAAQSAATSPTAPMVAELPFRFAQLTSVRSDSDELAQVLQLLVAAGILTNSRAARIAAFLPPL